MLDIFRTRPKHTHLPQRDAESDSDTLLPASASSTSQGLKPNAYRHTSRDVRIAVRTLILCTIVYVGGAIWIALSVNQTNSVADLDDVCIHHVSKYCT
jgi:hypothetical protein